MRYVVQVELSVSRGLYRKRPPKFSRTFANKLAEESARLREPSYVEGVTLRREGVYLR